MPHAVKLRDPLRQMNTGSDPLGISPMRRQVRRRNVDGPIEMTCREFARLAHVDDERA
jgi:hypothetical protein